MKKKGARHRRRWHPAAVLGLAAVAGIVGGTLLQLAIGKPLEAGPGSPADENPFLSKAPPPRFVPSRDRPRRFADANPRSLSATEGLPTYPGSRPEGFHGDIRARDIPMNMAWFHTSDPIEEVMAWYKEELTIGGQEAFAHRYSPASGYVGYHDEEAGKMRVVAVMRQGDGTMVMPGATKVSDLHQSSSTPPPKVPHPRDAMHTNVIEIAEGGTKQTTITGLVLDRSIDDLEAFYAEDLERRGWRVDRRAAPRTDGTARLEARRGGEYIDVSLSGGGPGVGGSPSPTHLMVILRSPNESPQAQFKDFNPKTEVVQ